MKAFAFKGDDIYPDTLVSGVDAIKVNLQARLSIVQGEYMPNTLLGVPLGATKDETDLYVQKVILGTTGVVGITEFGSVVVDKVYKCKFVASTIYGRLQYE